MKKENKSPKRDPIALEKSYYELMEGFNPYFYGNEFIQKVPEKDGFIEQFSLYRHLENQTSNGTTIINSNILSTTNA